MNLISKLIDKLQNVSPTTKRRIISLILAGGMAFSGLTMAGCDNTSTTTPPPIVDSGTQNPAYAKYSKILQNVLNDENNYYYHLIGNADAYGKDSLGNCYAMNHPQYQCIPYGFLEDEGFDIEKLKNKELYCYSQMYSKGNDLYIEVKAEKQASTNYLTDYILKYQLSEKEMNDLQNLFVYGLYNGSKVIYYQAPFFIQELSYLKDPAIISKAYITKAALDASINYFNKNAFLGKYHGVTYLGSEYVPDSVIAYHKYQIKEDPSIQSETDIATIIVGTNGYGRLSLDGITIHNTTKLASSGILTSANRELFENSISKVTAYDTTNCNFMDLKLHEDMENVLGN